MKLPSASRLPIVQNCTAAGVLPVVRRESKYASMGSAGHKFLQRLSEGASLEEAVKDLPEDKRAFYEALPLSAYPVKAGSYACEVAFAWDAATGAARELHRGGNRDYSMVKDGEIPGTADIVALEGDDTVYVGDWKTGAEENMPSAKHHLQLKALGLFAARTYGRSKVVVELIHVPFTGGRPHLDRHEMDAFELDEVELQLKELCGAIADASSLDPFEVPAAIGSWCRYCDSLPYCPAQTAMVRTASVSMETLKEKLQLVLDPDNAARGYHLLQGLKAMIGHLEQALYAFAAQTPIDLGDGNVLGEVETSRESVDPQIAFDSIAKICGEEAAMAACTLDTSKAAIGKAVGAWAKSQKQKQGVLIETVFEEIRRRGGAQKKFLKTVKKHKPKQLGEGAGDGDAAEAG